MGRRVMRVTYSGAVCEVEIYSMPDGMADPSKAKPRERFKCEEDRARHRDMMSRRRNARDINENCGPWTLYLTLTMSDECEVHTFGEARQIQRNYIRRLQRACPGMQVVRAVMGRGKNTSRIHFHMLVNGVDKETAIAKWNDGSVVRADNLRAHNRYGGVDHGRDYTGLANYLFDHWTPEQGGNRWTSTRNLRKPDARPPVEHFKRNTLNKPPAAPKGHILVESRAGEYGYLYYKYVRRPDMDAGVKAKRGGSGKKKKAARRRE